MNDLEKARQWLLANTVRGEYQYIDYDEFLLFLEDNTRDPEITLWEVERKVWISATKFGDGEVKWAGHPDWKPGE